MIKLFLEGWRKLFSMKYPVLIIWVFLGMLTTYRRINTHSINNYLIFKFSYFNALAHQNLYAEYPQHYFDSNHYGPLFSLIIAPFALMPEVFQMYSWNLANILLLFFAVSKLPLSTYQKNIIALVVAQEEYISVAQFQTNGAIAALIILSWVYIQNKNEFWAAFCLVLGFYVKLYGIVGLAFFFLTDRKTLFTTSFLFWSVALFVLPMAFFGPSFIIQSYQDWYHSLEYKNAINAFSEFQDISVMGMIRRICADRTISSLPFIVAGVIVFLIPYLNLKKYQDKTWRFQLLASVLIFPVLFSSSSELVTYVIAFTGVGIWFVTLEKPASKYHIVLFIVTIYVGSFFLTDLFPHYLKAHFMKPYALKALPCLLVWLTIIQQMTTGMNKKLAQLPARENTLEPSQNYAYQFIQK